MIRWLLITLAVLTALLLPRWGHPQSVDEDMRTARAAGIREELASLDTLCREVRTDPAVRCLTIPSLDGSRVLFVVVYHSAAALEEEGLVDRMQARGEEFCATMRYYGQPARYVEVLGWERLALPYDCQAQMWLPAFPYDEHGTGLQEAPGGWR